MSALSNASSRSGGQEPTHIGLTSNVIPEGKLQRGVSVEYTLDPTKKWYVLRVSYGRSMKASEHIAKLQIDFYHPLHKVVKLVNNKRRKVTEPLLPNLIFVYAPDEVVEQLVKDLNPDGLLSYYYNHFHEDLYGKNPPLTISIPSMNNFIRATSVDEADIRVVKASQCVFKSGDRVRVTEGTFKGVEGRVARAGRQQRVVVELEGLCLVATAYIPTAFLCPIPAT
ncbi:UpxY family transcription antiterminator [Parabacteroides distasonis]|nr:UpxY family transcription antiterminator [Parabacteroides distasonis]